MSSNGLGIWDRQNQPATTQNGDQFGLRAFAFPSVPATSPPRVTEDWKSLQQGLMRVQAITRAVSTDQVPMADMYTPSVATTDDAFSPMPQFGLGAAQSFFPGYSLSSQPAASNAPQLVRVGSFAPSAIAPGGRRRSLSIYSMDSSMTPLPGGFATPLEGPGGRPMMDRVSSFVEPSPIPSLMLDEPPTALEARSTTRGGIVETNARMDLPASLWMARPSIAPPLPSPDGLASTPRNLAPLPLQPVLDNPPPPPKPIQPLTIVKKAAPSPIIPDGGKPRRSKGSGGGHRKTFSTSSILSSGTFRAARRLSLTLRTGISSERKSSAVPSTIVAATLAVSPRPMSVNAFGPSRGGSFSAVATSPPHVPVVEGHTTPPQAKRSPQPLRISNPVLIPIPPVLERSQTARSLPPPTFARTYVPTGRLERQPSRLKKLPPTSPGVPRHHHHSQPQHYRQDAPHHPQQRPYRQEHRHHQPQYHRQREPSKPPSRKPSASRFIIDLHGAKPRSVAAPPLKPKRSRSKKPSPFSAVGNNAKPTKNKGKAKGLSWGILFGVGGFRKSSATATAIQKRPASAASGKIGAGTGTGGSVASYARQQPAKCASGGSRPSTIVSRKPVPAHLRPQDDPEGPHEDEGEDAPAYDFSAYYDDDDSSEPGGDEGGTMGDDEDDENEAVPAGEGGDGATNFTSGMRRLSTFQRSPRCFNGPSRTFSDVDEPSGARSASPSRSRGSSRDRVKLKTSTSMVEPSPAKTSISLPSRAATEPVFSRAGIEGKDRQLPVRPALTPVDSFKRPSRTTSRPGIAAARRTPALHGSSPPRSRHCSPSPSTPTPHHQGGGGGGGLGRVDFHYPSGSRQSAPSPDVTPLAAPSGMVQQATYFASAARPSPVPTVESSYYSPLPPAQQELPAIVGRNAFDLGERTPLAAPPAPPAQVKVGGGFVSPFASYALAGRPSQPQSNSFSFNRATARAR